MVYDDLIVFNGCGHCLLSRYVFKDDALLIFLQLANLLLLNGDEGIYFRAFGVKVGGNCTLIF
jgi:hypothetical protein